MNDNTNQNNTALLVFGDFIVYLFSLVITLAVRYGEIPSRTLLIDHLPSFSILFIVFLLVNFSAGLYDKQVAFIRKQSQGLLMKIQIMNIFIGVAFFYIAPVGIAPKANLVIYFILSTAFLFLWRNIMFPVLSVSKVQKAILIGEGEDIEDIMTEINGNKRYGLIFDKYIKPDNSTDNIVQSINNSVREDDATVIVADFNNKTIESVMPFLYSLVFSGIKIIDASKFYESIFDRVPLSMVQERWLVENSSTALGNRRLYDFLKRIIDIIVSLVGLLVSVIFYPFIILAIKLEDRGPIFIYQNRVGANGRLIKIMKFRSMSGNDDGKYNNGKTDLCVTKVGSFLRISRLDEIPQFVNILKGDLSLVGPRPELPQLVEVYKNEIPYYNVRHLVKPGACGWAQIYHENHPHHGVATEDTKDKLSYDLYYIKNRSLFIDIKIIFRTLQILMKRAGR